MAMSKAKREGIKDKTTAHYTFRELFELGILKYGMHEGGRHYFIDGKPVTYEQIRKGIPITPIK